MVFSSKENLHPLHYYITVRRLCWRRTAALFAEQKQNSPHSSSQGKILWLSFFFGGGRRQTDYTENIFLNGCLQMNWVASRGIHRQTTSQTAELWDRVAPLPPYCQGFLCLHYAAVGHRNKTTTTTDEQCLSFKVRHTWRRWACFWSVRIYYNI